ncbi:response regulator [Mangrovihabitans endophyticus]|uniref:DNA-binding response regulator n=1 Tax=Mangrovihabitans endophyticus TaxID=1751298 RepID=A0A8J3FMC3_9ACTN|nr:response regulator transcription factor [Mangrovihabitans endophyticus]GGK81919.1 DNA-binding response regulator [Mangrovihabitans endophyticus]
MTIHLLLADDQPLIRAGFRMFVDPEPDVEVVGEASSGAEAVELARALNADVVLMDLRMPEMDGIEATRRIANADDLDDVRVLVLTTFDDDENVVRALRAGASGFLGKHVQPAELVHAIRVVAAGEALLSPAATKSLITRFLDQPTSEALPDHPELEKLTAREQEVLTLVAYGLTNDEIADRLYVSPFTVRSHVARSMTKLGARDRAQLVVIAYQGGLIAPWHG